MFPHIKPPAGTQINPLHPLSKGLVGCWLFNEGAGSLANDISGYKNHGRLTNMAPNIQGSGWGNDGLEFDGMDDYVDLNPTWTPLTYTDVTIMFWYKSKLTTVTDDQYVFVDGNPPLLAGSIMCGITDDAGHIGEVRFWLDDGVSWINGYNGINMMDKEWHHIVCQRSGSDIILYTDGIQTIDGTFSNSITPSSGHTFIGDDPGNTEQVNGTIDSICIYNRALSAEEVAWSYREPYAMFDKPLSPALLYAAAAAGAGNPYWYYEMLRRRNR